MRKPLLRLTYPQPATSGAAEPQTVTSLAIKPELEEASTSAPRDYQRRNCPTLGAICRCPSGIPGHSGRTFTTIPYTVAKKTESSKTVIYNQFI